MKEIDKELLIKDLSARLPYGVICKLSVKGADVSITEKLDLGGLEHFIFGTMDVKPYLRPMSSMTKEEKYIYRHMLGAQLNSEGESIMFVYIEDFPVVIDWLNKNHFDYRKTPDGETMIEAGLALEAPEDMYE